MTACLSKDWAIELEVSSQESANSSEIIFLGDVALARKVGDLIDEHGPSYPFKNLADYVFDAEAVVFNLECCLSNRGTPWEPKPVLMRGKPEYLEVFPRNGQQYVGNVANNHFLDYGEEASFDTLQAISDAGMDYFGVTGEMVDNLPYLLNTDNGVIALLAYSPCAHPFPDNKHINVSYKSIDLMVEDVKNAINLSDVVIVSLHQGVEFCKYVDKASRNNARKLINAGADVVICHHTHVLEGIEKYEKGIIFYGIGNFIIDINTKEKPSTRYSLVLRLLLSDGKIKHIKVDPYLINENLQVDQVYGDEKVKLLNDINKLSSLLEGKIGIFLNDILVTISYIKLHMASYCEMISREGIKKTMQYYFKRIIEKSKTN